MKKVVYKIFTIITMIILALTTLVACAEQVVGISFTKSEMKMYVGDRSLITANSPDGSPVGNLIWESSDNEIATVDDSGWVLALCGGETTITATTKDGLYKAQLTLTVIQVVTGVDIISELDMEVGQTHQMQATIIPETATEKRVLWYSSNENVASIDQVSGLLTAKSVGQTTITVKTRYGFDETNSYFEDKCVLTVTAPVKGVKLSRIEHAMKEGETFNLTATVMPITALNKNISWDNSNDSVVEILDVAGDVFSKKVIAKSIGTSVVSVTTEDGDFTARCNITVTENNVFKVEFNTNGGSEIPYQTIEQGGCASAPENPEKLGYDFMGWDFDFNTPITSNVVVNASWQGKTYTITLDAVDGDIISGENQITVTYGQKIGQMPVAKKEGGYYFVGWHLLNDYFDENSVWEIAKDVTLTAKYQMMEYTVKYQLTSQVGDDIATVVPVTGKGIKDLYINLQTRLEEILPDVEVVCTNTKEFMYDGWKLNGKYIGTGLNHRSYNKELTLEQFLDLLKNGTEQERALRSQIIEDKTITLIAQCRSAYSDFH